MGVSHHVGKKVWLMFARATIRSVQSYREEHQPVNIRRALSFEKQRLSTSDDGALVVREAAGTMMQP